MTLGVHGEDFRVQAIGATWVTILCSYCGDPVAQFSEPTLAELETAAGSHDCPRTPCDHGVSHRAACTECTGPGPNETG